MNMYSYSSNNRLARFIKDQIGPGKRWKSARHLSVSAGLNPNQVMNVIQRGRAEPENLAKLADHLGISPAQMFVLAGWLQEEDIQGPAPLPVADQLVLNTLHRLTDDQLRLVLAVAEGFLIASNQQGARSPAPN
jgi:hypothetical protein